MPDTLTVFDVNGSYGCGATTVPEFPTLGDRLRHMDRIGVARAVVWNIEARQDACAACNRRLLEAIADTPGAAERIAPALALSPLMLYNRGALAELRETVRSRGLHAFRFTRGLTGVTLAQIEPVVREIADCRPVIVLTCTETDATDILAFAERVPEATLVLSEVGWSKGAFVLDLMARRRNVLLDTSWLHTWGAVELIVRRFGAERLVFGTGLKSHNGASLAALACAQVDERDRDLIAHGNLERLLGLPAAAPATPAAGRPDNPLWPRLLARQPLGVDLVDAHAHLGPSGGYVIEETDVEDQIPSALQVMDRLGVKTMIASGMQALMGDPVAGNDRLERELTPHTGRLRGYVTFNPFYHEGLTPRLDRYFASPVFVGFKTLCDYWRVPITDPRFEPMWQYADRHRLPILMHTWQGAYDSPAMLAGIVPRYPDAQFILGHSGGGDDGRREAEALAATHPNVHLEWCGSFCSGIPWEETLQTVDPAQVVFGTDAVFHDMTWELGRLLSVDAPGDVLAPILGANMQRILARRR